MSIARSVAEVLREHVMLEAEAIDRMYLNVYVPHLQSAGAVVGYLRVHRAKHFVSATMGSGEANGANVLIPPIPQLMVALA